LRCELACGADLYQQKFLAKGFGDDEGVPRGLPKGAADAEGVREGLRMDVADAKGV
jgi:hypothetical protein